MSTSTSKYSRDRGYKSAVAIERMMSLRQLVKQTDGFLQAEGGAAGGRQPAILTYPLTVKDPSTNEPYVIERSPRQTGFLDFFQRWNLQINREACIGDYRRYFDEDLSQFQLSDAELWTEYMCTKLERRLPSAHYTNLENYDHLLNFYVTQIPPALITNEWSEGACCHPSRGIRTATDQDGNQYIVNFDAHRVLKALGKQPAAHAYEAFPTYDVIFIKQTEARQFITDFIAIVYPGANIEWKQDTTDCYIRFALSTTPWFSYVMEISPTFGEHIHFKIWRN